MRPAIKAQLRDLAETMEESARQIVTHMRDRLTEYERVNGLVTPAPAGFRQPRRNPSELQAMGMFKRLLLQSGEYVAPEPTPEEEVNA